MYPTLPSVHSRGFSGNFQGSIAVGRAAIIAFYVHDGKAFFLIYVYGFYLCIYEQMHVVNSFDRFVDTKI